MIEKENPFKQRASKTGKTARVRGIRPFLACSRLFLEKEGKILSD